MFDGSGKIPQYYFSAFGLAVQQGFQGSLDDWLKSLIGPPGDPGKNAYQYAVEGGFEGTEEDFAVKMGTSGKSAYEYARENGYKGTEEDFGLKMAALDIRLLNGKEADKFGVLNLVPADLGAIDQKGGKMQGQLEVPDPEKDGSAVPRSYVVPKTGGQMTGALEMNGNAIKDVKDPENPQDVATKKFVEGQTLKFNNVQLQTTDFTDSGIGMYPWKATAKCEGVTAEMYPGVSLSDEDADSGAFSHTCRSTQGGVEISVKAKPEKAITIPTIIVWR